MKKFLIFLVSIVVVVCVGLTTFYFMKNDEIIVIETKEIYVNAGDTITLEELGFSRKKASKKTTFDYNAGGDDVKNAVSYDESKGYYIVNGSVAGDVTLVITTSNKKYAEFTVTVHIGNGEKETPYYVFNETDLSKIGAEYGLSAYFKLMNNIVLSSNFAPVGYSKLDAKYVGFSGNFDGNGKTISSLNLTDSTYSNAGLFSSINSSAVVSNLTIANSSVSGAYANAGILAGEISGSVDRIAILSSTVTSSENNANIGALAGSISGTAKLTYANNVVVNAGTETSVKDVNVGGLFGKINQATVQASYVNNANISTDTSSTGNFGGFAGEFIVSTNAGSIQQSYASVNSTYANLGAFLGGISTNGTVETADVIKFLIGNAVVTNGKEVVTNYDNALFTSFKDTANSTYLIDSFATQGEMQIATETNNGLVFYAISSLNMVYWDTEYIWETSTSSLPVLRFTKLNPELPSGEYFRKDLAQNEINETTSTFEDVFSADVENTKFLLLNDVTISNHTPVNLKNVTFDGNNKTITLALNNKNGENLGLFGKLDNCTIKNLNIVITGVNANASNVGAVAGTVLSSDSISSSSLENITITFQNSDVNITAINFGGVVAVAEKTNIKNVSVIYLKVSGNIANVGGAVAELKSSATIDNVKVSGTTLSGNVNVGGVVANNSGNITNVKNSNVTINYNTNVAGAKLGGISANNNGNILNSNIAVAININNADSSIYAGGVSAINNGTISNVKISGNGIAVSETNADVYVGGVVATNNSTIELTTTTMTSVGANFAGKNIKAGGVACYNYGTISKVVTKTNVYGNYAGGVFVEMNSSSANADQVVVANTVKGEKYVAGVIVVFKAGTITNVQATSTIEGATNSTRCSLITLIFPYGAKLQNATINSAFAGYGIYYRETWKDFSAYSNKDEFGLPASSGADARFNLYDNDTHHGCMQSVVLNTSQVGVSSAVAPMGDAWGWSKTYTDSTESSFIKYVSEFSSASQFSGSFEFVCATSTTFGIKHKVTRNLTFEIGTVWVDNGSGISLAFAK